MPAVYRRDDADFSSAKRLIYAASDRAEGRRQRPVALAFGLPMAKAAVSGAAPAASLSGSAVFARRPADDESL